MDQLIRADTAEKPVLIWNLVEASVDAAGDCVRDEVQCHRNQPELPSKRNEQDSVGGDVN